MKLIIRQTLDWDKQELREIEFDKVRVVNVRDIYMIIFLLQKMVSRYFKLARLMQCIRVHWAIAI